MKKDKFQEAVWLGNRKTHLLEVKEVISGGTLYLRRDISKFVTIEGALLKKLNEIVDEEIREVDRKIENL